MAKKNSKEKIQVWVYSHNSSNDAAVHAAAKKEDFGSGMGPEGRDISFFAQNEAHALRMKDRTLQVAGVFMVEIIYPGLGTATFRTKSDPDRSTWRNEKRA